MYILWQWLLSINVCTVVQTKYIQRSKGMSEVSKVHTGLSIQSYVTHVEGVESSSLYTIRAVMPCMSKVLKEAQNGLEHFCS